MYQMDDTRSIALSVSLAHFYFEFFFLLVYVHILWTLVLSVPRYAHICGIIMCNIHVLHSNLSLPMTGEYVRYLIIHLHERICAIFFSISSSTLQSRTL